MKTQSKNFIIMGFLIFIIAISSCSIDLLPTVFSDIPMIYVYDMIIVNDYIYCLTYNGIYSIYIRDNNDLLIVDIDDVYAKSIIEDNGVIFATNESWHTYIYTINVDNELHYVTAIQSANRNIESMYANGDLLYLLIDDLGIIECYDVADLHNPAFLWSSHEPSLSSANNIVWMDGNRFIVDSYEPYGESNESILFCNIINNNISIEAQININNGYGIIDCDKTKLYILRDEHIIDIYDISVYAMPKLIDSYDNGREISAACENNGYIYLGSENCITKLKADGKTLTKVYEMNVNFNIDKIYSSDNYTVCYDIDSLKLVLIGE